jgi:hypothetical protein
MPYRKKHKVSEGGGIMGSMIPRPRGERSVEGLPSVGSRAAATPEHDDPRATPCGAATASKTSGGAGPRTTGRGNGQSGWTSAGTRSRIGGPSLATCSAPAAATWTSGARWVGSSASRYGPGQPRAARAQGPARPGRQPRHGPPHRPLVRRGGELREATRDGTMELVVRDAGGFPGLQTANGTNNRPALPRGVMHARGDRQGGPGLLP